MRAAVKGVALAGAAATVAVLASLAANAATSQDRWPGGLDLVRRQPWYWVAGLAAAAVLVAGVMAWRQERSAAPAADPPPPPTQSVPDWVVDRAERARTVKAVCRTRRRRGRTVAITTSLEGAGGFGKTTLALAVASSPRVRRYFRGRIYTITIGRDVRGRAAVAAKVAEATRFITGDTNTFDDPGLAGDHLGRLLDRRPRSLLLLDDVWDAEQLGPFLRGGERCVRLVTTRVPAALPRGTERVRVDEMSPAQARAVLTWELPRLPEELVRGLLRATGGWALLLRLTNRLVTRHIATGADAAAAATEVLRGLVALGPVAVDSAPAVPDPDATPAVLDLDDPARRALAVRATVDAATTLLPPGGARRLAELAVFVEDESIPVPLIARLWAATGGLTEAGARTLCGQLDRLSLVSLAPDHGGRIVLHDVLRDYLRKELGEAAVVALHGTLVDVMGVPWESSDGYVLDHAIEHLLAAGRTAEAGEVAGDLRWVEARLHQRGPLAAWSDLYAVPTREAADLADVLTQTAHLLTPTDPPELLTNVLHSRLEGLAPWHHRIRDRQADPAARPLLRNRELLPDLPARALLRTFLGHTGPVRSVAVSPVAPEETSLVTIGADGMARGLDPGSGGSLTVDVRGPDRFRALAMAPDGSWLATGGNSRLVHLWSLERGTPARKTVGPVGARRASVRALAISPGGTLILTLATDSALEVWDVETGECVAEHWPLGGEFTCVAISPDGGWLAVGGSRGVELMSMDLTTRLETRGLTSGRRVNALAVTWDGNWLVSAEADGVLQVWDAATRSSTCTVHAHSGAATAVAVSADGTWLATGGEDGTVAVWDRVTGDCRFHYAGHGRRVHAVTFTADGNQLISSGDDGTVKVWNTAGSGREERASDRRRTRRPIAVIGDGSWLATVLGDGGMRLWDPRAESWRMPTEPSGSARRGPTAFAVDGSWYATTKERDGVVTLVDRVRETELDTLRLDAGDRAQALAIAPDGTWLAVADSAGTAQLWNRATGRRTSLRGAVGTADAVTIAPDGSWLAVLRHRTPPGQEEESVVTVFHLASGQRTVDLYRGEKLTAMAIAPGRGCLVTASLTGVVSLWHPVTGALLTTFTDPDGSVHGLSVSPDGDWISTAGPMLRVWNATTCTAVAAVRAETPMTSCAWLPDGRGLVAVGELGLYTYEFCT